MGLAEGYVRDGAAWVERYAGEGWYNRIDLTRLSLWSDRWCILGQLFGSYHHAKAYLGMHEREMIAYGFVGRHLAADAGIAIAYPDLLVATSDDLVQAWRELIVVRRYASSPFAELSTGR